MIPAGILRKNLTFGEGVETLRSWVSVNKDLEVSLVRKEGTFSVFAFVALSLDSFDEEDGEFLVQADSFESENQGEAEERFHRYTSNFI